MHILLTNDDGIEATGLLSIYEALQSFARVTVVAPMREQSGSSHAITLGRPLRIQEHYRQGKRFGWKVDGTPADCVKLGLAHVLEEKPDLIVSGINHGPNVGDNVFYSGTVAAAVEGFIQNISGVALSLDTVHGREFGPPSTWAAEFIEKEFSESKQEARILNINIPGRWADLQGVRVTRHSRSGFKEEYEKRQDPAGKDYYWVKGYMHIDGDRNDSDAAAVRHGYISITPFQIDWSHPKAMRDLEQWHSDKV